MDIRFQGRMREQLRGIRNERMYDRYSTAELNSFGQSHFGEHLKDYALPNLNQSVQCLKLGIILFYATELHSRNALRQRTTRKGPVVSSVPSKKHELIQRSVIDHHVTSRAQRPSQVRIVHGKIYKRG